MFDIRCGGCSRLLARVSGCYTIQIKCPRCRTLNHQKAESLPKAPPSALLGGHNGDQENRSRAERIQL
ncbi:Com family DNA-binding transcriptional regulator [Pseudomonas segetis]|uniref:Mu-like prophage protein Com n=1 Tax=Pseudomonas segetis TaxID=298908 RepID=A0A239JRR6_9PSED|nr:Com family DNA-binding transcriptional regulator [Pseudomonas segetis]SNT08063.1 Mu-like prophage protein Com [Pseudomonas segetis]